MTCQDVINAEQIRIRCTPATRPFHLFTVCLCAFSQTRVECGHRSEHVQCCLRLSFDLPWTNWKQCNRIVHIAQLHNLLYNQRLTWAAATHRDRHHCSGGAQSICFPLLERPDCGEREKTPKSGRITKPLFAGGCLVVLLANSFTKSTKYTENSYRDVLFRVRYFVSSKHIELLSRSYGDSGCATQEPESSLFWFSNK